MKVFRFGGAGLVVMWFLCAHGAAAAADISGTYWATSYSPKLQVVGGGEPPLNAAGKAAYAVNQAGLADGSLVDRARGLCVPDGVPRVLATPYPFEVLQVPAGQVTFVYEMNHQQRVIVLDKPLAKLDSLMGDPWYNGHSVGRFDGDTLVVESAGYNETTFLDASGLPHSEALSTLERIRKLGNRLEDIITIHDPQMYASDWQARFAYEARTDVRIEDYACNDTHRDLSQVSGARPR
jgi:hypothetical protein